MSALLFAVTGASFAQPVRHAAMDTLVVKITTTSGTTWGKVTVHWDVGTAMHSKKCATAKCTFHTPAMVKLTINETANSPATWPFQEWKVTNGGKTKSVLKHKDTFEIMGGMATAQANYILK